MPKRLNPLLLFIAFVFPVAPALAEQSNPVIVEALKLAETRTGNARIEMLNIIQDAQQRLNPQHQEGETTQELRKAAIPESIKHVQESLERAKTLRTAEMRSGAYRNIADTILLENVNSFGKDVLYGRLAEWELALRQAEWSMSCSPFWSRQASPTIGQRQWSK